MDKRGLGEVVGGGDVVRHRVVDRQRNHGRPYRIRLQVRWVVSRGHTSIHMSAEDLMNCPDCERYKLSAQMWRNEAYKHAGIDLPWKPEELLKQEYERGFAAGLRFANEVKDTDK